MCSISVKVSPISASGVYTLPVAYRSWLLVALLLMKTTDSYSVQPPSDNSVIVKLREVVVTGNKTEQTIENSTSLVQVISKSEVENLGAENLGQVLENYAGLVVRRDEHGDGLQMQGLDPEYVLILIDGQPQIGRIAGKLDLTRITVENIDRIEIVKGASSTLFGSDAMGGVINVITQSATEPIKLRMNNNFQPNNLINNRASLEFSKKRFTSALSVSHNQADPFDLEPVDRTTTIDGYRNLTLASRFGYELNKKTNLLLTTQYLKQHQNGITEFDNGWYERTGELDTYNLQIAANYQLGPKTKIVSKVYRTKYQDRSVTTSQPQRVISEDNTTIQHLTKVECQFETNFSSPNQLVLGLESTIENLSSQRIQGRKKTIQNNSGFAQYQWQISQQLTTLVGVRLDSHSQFGHHVTPKLSTMVNLGLPIQIRGSWGRGFRAPTFQNLYLDFTNPTAGYQVLGNPNLKPEFSNSLNLSFTSRWLQNHQAQLHLYRNDLVNLIEAEVTGESAAGGSKYQYKNVARAFTSGIDTTFSTHFFDVFNLRVGHALLIAKNKETGLALLGRSRHNFHLKIGRQFMPIRLDVDLRARYANRWGLYDDGDYVLEDEEYAPSYWIWDFGLRKKFSSSWQLNGGINNLFNFKSPQFYTFTGRTFYLGFSLV